LRAACQPGLPSQRSAHSKLAPAEAGESSGAGRRGAWPRECRRGDGREAAGLLESQRSACNALDVDGGESIVG
jgi:hypothetical protein